MSSQRPRRQFLRQSLLGSLSVGFATLSSSPEAAEEPSNRVVVGMMGLKRGMQLAEQFAVQPGVEIRYVCETDSERGNAAADSIEKLSSKRPQVIGDFRRILDDRQVDALVCAAPNHWHGPATILACAAGKHVYVEKPCCHNPREGELMVAAARKYKRAVQVGTQRRSSEKIAEAFRLLQEGVIGDVHSARASYGKGRESIGRGKQVPVPAHIDYELWQGPAPRIPFTDNRLHYSWHWFWHYGNGELGNNGVHSLDVCRWGLGVDYPNRVTSSGGRYYYDDDQQTPDTQIVAFEFPDRKLITWHGESCNRFKTPFAVFCGSNGSLEILDGGGFIVYAHRNKVLREEPGTIGEPSHIQNFLSAIRDDNPQALNCEIEEGHKSTLLCHLGNIAHRTGRTLNCNPQNGQIQNDAEAMKLWSRDYEPGWEPKV